MESNEKILEIISNETLGSACKMSVVTPSIYHSMFTHNATGHDADIKDEDKLSNDILNSKISMFQNLQTETTKNAVKLGESTNKAILAIKDKNEDSLNEVLKETQELRREIEKLKESVYKDELTHAYNRKWLHDNFLTDDTDIFTKNGTLAIIDLNYFKLVNDTYGHIVGDKVLIFIANQLKQTKESVTRYGGDEFIILFSEKVTQESALQKLNKIREDIISKKLKAGNSAFRVSFSFGAQEFKKDDSLSNIIELADKNMYDDKVQIKKRVTGI